MKKNILIACVLLVVIALLSFLFYPKTKESPVKRDIAVSSAPEKPVEVRSLPEPVPEQEEKKTVSGLKASFDIVRVEKDGSMIAAGKGQSGAVVSLMDGDSVLTDFTVNEEGEWVYIPTEPLAVGEHEIWLRDDSMNSRDLSEVVVVSVPEPENAGQALAVMMSADAQDVNVLQAPEPQIQADIDIRSVNYVDGAFVVKGTARETGRVNVYMDNLFLGHTDAKKEDWTFRISRRLEAGKKYLIRADKVDLNGKVVSRVEVPFEMEKGLEKNKRRRVRVVKGDCLWAIAKQLYGSGFAYTTIYQANKKQIKDPNLIYPNQVFILPVKAEK